MKAIKIILPLVLSMIIVLNLSSCFLVLNDKKDNGHHKGWYKNPNNPHHPNTNKNGNGHGNGHGKHK